MNLMQLNGEPVEDEDDLGLDTKALRDAEESAHIDKFGRARGFNIPATRARVKRRRDRLALAVYDQYLQTLQRGKRTMQSRNQIGR